MKMIVKTYSAVIALLVCAMMAGCGSGHMSNSLNITLASGSVTAGSTAQLRATRDNADGNPVDVTNAVTWKSSQPSVATVNAQGVLTSLVPGTTGITATVDQASGALTVAVGAPAVTQLVITPQTSSVPIGYPQQFYAKATYANGTSGDDTSGVTWSVAPSSVADIDQNGLLFAKALGTFTVTATANGVTVTASGTASNAVLTSIAITPSGAGITTGATQQFTDTASFSDGSTHDVTAATVWSSSNPSLLSISSTGLATAPANGQLGSVTIFGQVSSTIASTQAKVIAAVGPALTALLVSPTASSVAKNTGQQLVATGYYADGSQQDLSSTVTWQSNNPSTSSVDSTGLVKTTTPGAATIQAQIQVPASSARRDAHGNAITTLQAQSVSLVTSATLVKVIAQCAVPSIPIEAAQQLQLFGIFSDGSKQDLTALATWQSSNAAVATVSSTGAAFGVAAGPVTFIGSFGGQSDTTPTVQVTATSLTYVTLHVNSSILIKGSSLPVLVTGHYSDGSTQDLTSLSTFSSSNPAAISVSSSGAALAVNPGQSTITATVQGQSSSTNIADNPASVLSVTVTPGSTQFALGTTQPFRALANFSNGASVDVTADCLWGSTNPAVFTVDATGVAKSGSVGTASVTALFLGTTGISGTVTVTRASMTGLVVSPALVQLAPGISRQLTAVATFNDGTTQDVTSQASWASANETITQTSNSGNVVALAPGNTQETATLMGFTASTSLLTVSNATLTSVGITPTNPIIAYPLSQQLSLIGTYSDGTTQDLTQCALWSSSAPLVATAVHPGLIATNSIGTATVTADCGGAAAFVTVTSANKTIASEAIVPSQAEVAVGGDQSFQLVLTFTDGTTQPVGSNVVWTSRNPAIGTLAGPVVGEDPGHAIGVSPGKATLTATASGGPQMIPLTATLYVTPKPVSSVAVTPANPTLVAGSSQQFTAQATYTDGTSGDISGDVQWTSSNPSLVSITDGGLATAHSSPAGGSATITATSGTFTATSVVQVPGDSSDVLTALTVVPTSSRIAVGTPQQLVALGTYTDGTTRDVSSQVTWTSSNPALATVSNTGLATGVAAGTVTILAQSGTLQSPSTLIVDNATLVSLSISPSGASFANGTSQQFQLIGTFSDGSTQVLSAAANWQSSNPAAATVSATGLAQGTGVGTAQISGTFDGQTATTSPVQVTAATLVSIAVQPSSASFAKGTSQQFKVTGFFSDGTTEDLTQSATFESSDPSVVNISSTGQASGVGVGTATVTVTDDGQTATTSSVSITPATLTSISITPANPRIAAGTNQAFTAVGTFSDGTTQNLTTQVVWTSANTAIATIDQNGVAESGGTGSTTFSAAYEGVTATTGTVQVTNTALSSLTITPNTGTLANGTTQQFTAMGTFTDGSTEDVTSQANWSSSNSAVLAINAAGLASAVGGGTAQITATFDGQTATTGTFTVTVATLTSVAISPTSSTVPKGVTQKFTLTGTFSDGSTQNLSSSATWSSTNGSVASVNSTGLASAVQQGSTSIVGSTGTQSAAATFNVSAAMPTSVTVSPTTATLAKGATQQFTATQNYSDGSMADLTDTITWSSSNNAVLSIDSHGVATGTGVGSATITGTSGNESSTTSPITVNAAALASITVSPSSASIAVSGTKQFTATGTYTDGSTQNLSTAVTWTSSTSNATVNSSGLATGVSPGSASIQAQDGSFTSSGALTITSTPVTATGFVVTPSSASIAKGTTQQYAAMVQYSDGSTMDVTTQTTWQSSTPSVATINSSGLATSVSGGSTQITGTYNAMSGTVPLTVSAATLHTLAITPATASIANGTTQQYTATGTLTDGSTENLTNSVTWSTGNSNATINANGLATAQSAGSTTIQAQDGSTASNTATLTITSATASSLQVQPASISMAAGNTQQLQVTATFSDGTSQNVTQSSTYVSADPSKATVSSGGLVMTVATGTTSITVTQGSATATVPVTVTGVTLSSITVTPANLSLPAGTTQQLTATGNYSDGSTANLTNSVTWASSVPATLTVNSTGILTAVQAGTANATATLNGVVGTLPVTVTSAAVRSISVSPSTATLAAGQTQQYAAIATLSDGSQQTVTSSAHWSVTDTTRASISNTAGSNGLLTALSAGSDTVNATVGSVTGTASVIVTSATLTSVSVSPTAFTLAEGTTQQLTVTGQYSDGSSQNLTNSSVYTTSGASTATVSSTGLVTATGGTGVATIMATDSGQSGTAVVTAAPGILTSVAITPATPTIPKGLTEQFTATGTYNVVTTANITNQVQWTSSAPRVATINSSGLATAVGAGTTTITATAPPATTNLSTPATTTLTVGSATLESIAVQAVSSSFANGTTLQLHAIGTYSDNSTADLTSSVTWTSLNTAVGVVSPTGLANGVSPGVFGAQAALGSVTASKSITVTNAVLQSITVTPANQVIVGLTPQQYYATGHFSDGSTQDLTNSVHWSVTSNLLGITIGSISQSGQLTAVAVGSGTVVASYNGITGSTPFTVASI